MKQKKVTKRRGSKTHGWGSMKKHRGAGNRGGRGNAGSGKRGDQKKPSYWNSKKPKGQKYGKDYFGKSGFYSVTGVEVKALNVRDLDSHIVQWVAEKKVNKTGDTYTVDLTAMGYDKLLGTGQISHKVKVTVARATATAVEKVSAAGGAVTVTAGEPSEEVAEEAAEEKPKAKPAKK